MSALTLSDLRPGDRLKLVTAPDWLANTYNRERYAPEWWIVPGTAFRVSDHCGCELYGCKETGLALTTERDKNNLVFHPIETDMALFRKMP